MALKTFIGEIAVFSKREVAGRNGPITAYSAKIVKPDGEEYDEWVGFGFKKPTCAKGDSVKIAAKKENGFWKAVDVEVTAEGDGEAGEPEQEEQESGDSGSKGKSGSSVQAVSSSSKEPASGLKDKRIGYQNSRTAALELTSLLLQHKAVPLAATAGKAGDAKRFEEVMALVDKLTVKLFNDLSTFRLLADVEDAYEAPAKAEKTTGDFDGESEGESDDE
jgi:hypothetical protein